MYTYLYISSFINVFFLIQKHLYVEAYHIKRDPLDVYVIFTPT